MTMRYKLIPAVLFLALSQMSCTTSSRKDLEDMTRAPANSLQQPAEFCGRYSKSETWSLRHLLRGAYYGYKTSIVPLNQEVDKALYALNEGEVICISGAVINNGDRSATLFGYRIRKASNEVLDKSLLDSPY